MNDAKQVLVETLHVVKPGFLFDSLDSTHFIQTMPDTVFEQTHRFRHIEYSAADSDSDMVTIKLEGIPYFPSSHHHQNSPFPMEIVSGTMLVCVVMLVFWWLTRKIGHEPVTYIKRVSEIELIRRKDKAFRDLDDTNKSAQSGYYWLLRSGDGTLEERETRAWNYYNRAMKKAKEVYKEAKERQEADQRKAGKDEKRR